MVIDFTRLNASEKHVSIEPRDIFMALPQKDKSYSYPRDVQTEVWKQWYEKRNEKNTIIKMNTGSGKTTVGLIILQSCLNEGKGPAVYVVPDKYLVNQVCGEALRLGIKVAYEHCDSSGTLFQGEYDYFFNNNQAIFVTTIQKLVNGKSVFGLRQYNNVKIGSIIIDDVHACMDTMEQQCTVKIDQSDSIYNQIINIFKQYQELKDNSTFYDITCEVPNPIQNLLIPFWIWQDCCEDIRRLLLQTDKDYVVFNLPLIEDIFKTCNCVISARCIEITPKCIPISKIVNFNRAERRIFMSATLANDNVFVSTMGLKANEINIITPDKANDIGERLILFPKHLNPKIDDKDVREKIVEIAHKHNCVVIVPSFERAEFWREKKDSVALQVLSSSEGNIYTGIDDLKNGSFKGLTVLVNKYDGVDLPDDACRFLIIDGLPSIRSKYDIVSQSMNYEDKRICSELIQKIEQGMGRGVRSNNDYCVIVLMGSSLADVIINQNGEVFFSKATQKQYEVSKKLWSQIMETTSHPTINDIFDLTDYVINRDNGWILSSKDALSSVEYNRDVQIGRVILAKRNAFEAECSGRYEDAFKIIEAEKNSNTDLGNKEKAILMQLMAEYRNFSNPSKAQEILLSAYTLNNMVIKPITGIQHSRLQSQTGTQGLNILDYILEKHFEPNPFIIHVHSILDKLQFAKDTAHAFENALNELARIIGFTGSRPENDGGPDNLWAVGGSRYFVIECKNGVDTNTTTISKSDCSQLLSSIQWFENLYSGNDFVCEPIIIHRAARFDALASPDPRMHIMTENLLEKFKESINKFAESISQNTVWGNPIEIQNLIIQHKLSSDLIISEYTISPK